MKSKIGGFILPGLFILAWIFTLAKMAPPAASPNESMAIAAVHWLLYMAGFVFIISFFMHSVFAKSTAKSIGWETNGFQYELAFSALGSGIACFYANGHGKNAWIAISIAIIVFLFLAGVNHVVEMVRKKNFAPNNTLILIWDFGMSISLAALLPSMIHYAG
jgi:cytochrome b561